MTISPNTPLDDLPEYITVEQLQAYLQLGRSSAYDLARRHGIRVGRLVRVPKAVLRALLAPSGGELDPGEDLQPHNQYRTSREPHTGGGAL